MNIDTELNFADMSEIYSRFPTLQKVELTIDARLPNWGSYSDGGRLETRAGYEAARHRLARFSGAEVIAFPALEWLGKLSPNSLDWAYVDSTHQYEPTSYGRNWVTRGLRRRA